MSGGKHTLLIGGVSTGLWLAGSLVVPRTEFGAVAVIVVVCGNAPQDRQELGELNLLILISVVVLKDTRQVIFAQCVLWKKIQNKANSVPKEEAEAETGKAPHGGGAWRARCSGC